MIPFRSQPHRSGMSSPVRQRGALGPRQVLILLALVFIAPGLIAWLAHLAAEQGWLFSGTTNEGTLIEPARPLGLPAGLTGPEGTPLPEEFLQGKWTLLYVGTGACEDACRQSLYHLRQVRLAQGENLRRVQRLFLVVDAKPGDLRQALEEYPDLAVGLLSEARAEPILSVLREGGAPASGAGRIYLVDPLGNLMMYYRPGADPRGMIQDLERLLKYSQIG